MKVVWRLAKLHSYAGQMARIRQELGCRDRGPLGPRPSSTSPKPEEHQPVLVPFPLPHSPGGVTQYRTVAEVHIRRPSGPEDEGAARRVDIGFGPFGFRVGGQGHPQPVIGIEDDPVDG